MNYYQFFSYVNILYSKLICLHQSYYLNPTILKENNKNETLKTREILYENLKEFANICTSPSYSDYNSLDFFYNKKVYSKET